MHTYELTDWLRPVTVTTCNGREVRHDGPMTIVIEGEPVFDTGQKVTITKEMPDNEGTVTYVYRRVRQVSVFGT